MDLKKFIRTIPDYPKQGIQFRDITTLIAQPDAFQATISQLATKYQDYSIDLIAGIEARGFIFGATLAHQLNKGFIPIRKKGKLPGKTFSVEYDLEYGSDKLEVHQDAFTPGDRVLLIDDLLATGGTALAACALIKQAKAEVIEAGFIIDLPDLKGQNKLEQAGINCFCLIEFAGH